MTDNNTSGKYIETSFKKIFKKMTPSARCTAKTPPLSEFIFSFIGAFLGLGAVCYLSYVQEIPVLIASFGASAVMLYAFPANPFAQPKNVLGGHMLSAFVGIFIYQMFGSYWFTAAASVALAIVVMVATKTTHPPAGGTALIALATGQSWGFIIFPVGAGAVILIAVALLVNNLAPGRSYPGYWR
jgi:CBS-domain-containing membrane protein